MKYTYVAIFTKEGEGYSVNFPDFESCYTDGDNLQHALEMAEDVLCLTLYNMEKNNLRSPIVTDIKKVSVNDDEFATLISCDTDYYKKFFENKAIKKTLSIPFRLNEEAERQNINFSQVLQEALRNRLGL